MWCKTKVQGENKLINSNMGYKNMNNDYSFVLSLYTHT